MNDIHAERSFFFVRTSKDEVLKVAMSIKSKLSSGHDNISNKVVKKLYPP